MEGAVTVDDILSELAATYKVELRQRPTLTPKQLGAGVGR
jgi:hypothetical protein